MHSFTIYVELNNKGRMSDFTYSRLKEYCNIVSNISLNLVWVFPNKVKCSSLRRIIKFERKFCTFKQLIVHNLLIAKSNKTSLLAKLLIHKYNFKFMDSCPKAFENDCVRICFGNQPRSCMFNSCLGKCVYIRVDGTPEMCPFIDNDISLSVDLALNSTYEIFNTESFVNLISNSIKRRNLCKNSCEYFPVCKGYCPLNSNDDLPENCFVRETIMANKKIFEGQTMANETFREQVIEQLAEKYRI